MTQYDAAHFSARCVDCGQEIPEDQIFRVLRRDSADRRHVVCQSCADRRHVDVQPTPLQVQRTAPRSRPAAAASRTTSPPTVAMVARWHRLLNSGQIEELMALIDVDIEVGGPRGTSRGAQTFRDWFGRAGVRLEPLQYFQRDNTVVVKETAVWHGPEAKKVVGGQVVASHFTIAGGVITGITRFDTLADALEAAGLTDADEVQPWAPAH